MQIFYWLLVLYLTINVIIALFREKKPWNQVAASLVLILFLLRLLFIQ